MSASKLVVCPHCQGINRVPEDRLRDRPKCGVCHQALFEGRPLELSAVNFRGHLEHGDIPLLVDFWAPWCGPCKVMAPVFAAAAAQFDGRVRFAKVDTDVEQGLAREFGIRGIPTLVLFKNGREAGRVSGALDRHGLQSWVQERL
ncbi:MAG: thioredoxin TrxC [Acidiferrobacterales bacterium]